MEQFLYHSKQMKDLKTFLRYPNTLSNLNLAKFKFWIANSLKQIFLKNAYAIDPISNGVQSHDKTHAYRCYPPGRNKGGRM